MRTYMRMRPILRCKRWILRGIPTGRRMPSACLVLRSIAGSPRSTIVNLHDEFDVPLSLRRINAHRHTVCDDAKLALKIDAVLLLRQWNVVVRTVKEIRYALIHKRSVTRHGIQAEDLLPSDCHDFRRPTHQAIARSSVAEPSEFHLPHR